VGRRCSAFSISRWTRIGAINAFPPTRHRSKQPSARLCQLLRQPAGQSNAAWSGKSRPARYIPCHRWSPGDECRPPARTAPTAPHIDRPDPADPDLDPQHGFCETTVHTVRCERAGAGVEKPRPDGSAPGPRIQNGATDPSSSRTRLENAHLHASPEPLTYRAMLWRRELQGRTRRSLHRKLPDRRPNQKT
jgi:hypothetical protein